MQWKSIFQSFNVFLGNSQGVNDGYCLLPVCADLINPCRTVPPVVLAHCNQPAWTGHISHSLFSHLTQVNPILLVLLAFIFFVAPTATSIPQGKPGCTRQSDSFTHRSSPGSVNRTTKQCILIAQTQNLPDLSFPKNITLTLFHFLRDVKVPSTE